MNTYIVVAVLIVMLLIAISAIAYCLGKTIGSLNTRLKVLEDYKEKLEESQAKRLPWKAASGIEDALAILTHECFALDAERLNVDAKEQQLKKATSILQTVRSNPHAYDEDAPAGKRPNRRVQV